ncbi:MAG TPA: hypothetical protein P5022_17910, partial [Candidatus Paceibacterota bacterium]|nr:hypothetical protein [Candidatus Paceibacterota bacterium]
VASAVQSTLVPSASVVELPGVRLAGHFSPATQCGGDWWGHYTAPDGRVLVAGGKGGGCRGGVSDRSAGQSGDCASRKPERFESQGCTEIASEKTACFDVVRPHAVPDEQDHIASRKGLGGKSHATDN